MKNSLNSPLEQGLKEELEVLVGCFYSSKLLGFLIFEVSYPSLNPLYFKESFLKDLENGFQTLVSSIFDTKNGSSRTRVLMIQMCFL